MRGADVVPFQCRSQRIGRPVCKTADVDLCQAGGSGDTKRRDPVSADRGKFLLSDRISVPVVRLFPGSQTSGDLSRTDRDLPRNACGARLYSLGKYSDRCGRDLGCGSDRLVSGRRGGVSLLPEGKEENFVKNPCKVWTWQKIYYMIDKILRCKGKVRITK